MCGIYARLSVLLHKIFVMNKNAILFSIIALLVSCSPQKSGNRTITVSIEPQRYFVEQLVDSLFEISTMVPSGMSPETYDPSPVQMAKLADSDAYFRIGQIGFEVVWMDKIKNNNPGLKIFDNSENILFLTSNEEDIDNCEEHGHSHEAHNHFGIDPHIWSSPKQASVIAKNMYESLVQLDKENEEIYLKNLNKLNSEIHQTDSIVSTLLKKATTKSFIIYHPALTYFAHDYGLTQHCIEIEGKEPTPEQLKQLIEISRKNDIRIIFIQQEFDQKNAEIIASETNCKQIVINPLSYKWSEGLIEIAQALSYE